MAKYSKAQLQKNRRAVSGVALAGAAYVALSFVASGFSLSTLIGTSVVAAVIVGALWWLFASRGAETLEGSWVDGFNHEGRKASMGFPGFEARQRIDTGDGPEVKEVADGICSDCGLPFGAAGETHHAGCASEAAQYE